MTKPNTKFKRYILVGTLVGTMVLTLAGCSTSNIQNTNSPTTNISEEIPNIDEETTVEETVKNNQLPSYYIQYNIFKNENVDKKYKVGYFNLEHESTNFIYRILQSRKLTIEGAEFFLNELNSKPELANKNYNTEYSVNEILNVDESSSLLKIANKDANGYALLQLKDDKGYLVGFFDTELKTYSNFIITYSNNDKRIIMYNKSTGDLIILENAIYLSNDNEIISFVRLDDKENIHHFDIKNMMELKEKVNNLKAYHNYLSYKGADNKLNIIDLLTSEKHEKDLGEENSWIKLSDGSIIYAMKNGNQIGYQKSYNIKSGGFDKDYCILDNLHACPDIKGDYATYNSAFYFNKKLDKIYEMPYYEKIVENNIEKGYIKYMQLDESDIFIDLTTGKRYYQKNTISSNEYTIYNVIGVSKESKSYSIFKDQTGKTVAEIIATPETGYIQKYFDEEKIAIQGNIMNGMYINPTIVNLSDLNNPKIILASTYRNSFNLISTPINTIFKVFWPKDNKYCLIDIKGNMLTEKVDFIGIYEATKEEKINNIAYVSYLCKLNTNNQLETNDIMYFDINGEIVNGKSYQKTMKRK